MENRYRPIAMILDGIRSRCGADFQVGIRLSLERFGIGLAESIEVATQVLADSRYDYLDLSLWDVQKEPEEEEFKGNTLLSYFTDLPRNGVRLGVAGKIGSGLIIQQMLDQGADFVSIGRAGVLHHNFAELVLADPSFEQHSLPVSRDYLAKEGLSPQFVEYMSRWPGFVEG